MIYDLLFQKTVNSIMHYTESCFVPKTITRYEVGSYVKPDWFDNNLNSICSHGIHYFLTLEAALSYRPDIGCCWIDGKEFDDNGC
jgi:hypothetical protein